MNFKKIAAVLAASATIFSAGMFNVSYADETTETEETAVSAENVEAVTSADGLWSYKALTDENGNAYAMLEGYYGNDTVVTIPSEVDGNPVTTLGEYTFYENTNVTKIIIPETLTDFGDFSFFGCTSISEFEVDEANELYTTIDGVIIGKDNLLFVCYPPAKPDTEYTVPDGVVAINPAAFAVCKNLEKVNFPDTLESMGLYCFAECTSLNNVVIPEKVSELAMFNFTGCTALTDIKLNDNMHTIGSGAFFACSSLNSIEFPKYIKEIGQCAFVSTAFTEIELPSTIQNIGYSAFGYTADQTGQLVPMSSFTVKGVTGSMAQSYCGENEHVTFEAVDEEVTEAADSENSDSDSKIKPGVIIACCIGGGVIIIALVVIIVFKKKNTSSDKEETIDETEAEEADMSEDNNAADETEE